MIPLRSSERPQSTAVVTLLLIAVNVLVFLYEVSLPSWSLDRFIQIYGLVPDRFHASSLVTSMFLHGGWMHLIGNMWFLWIFGRNVEDLLGPGTYLSFYLASGVAAALLQTLVNSNSTIPTVGASGAIAGVMGGYVVAFPRARVVTVIVVFVFITTVDIPAVILLVYWFVIQVFSGLGAVARVTSGASVAWFAHVGGFVAGLLLMKMLPKRPRYRAWS